MRRHRLLKHIQESVWREEKKIYNKLTAMAEIVEEFERKARFKDEIEADLIREKLETLVISILTKVEQRDERFESTLIQSGSVYEGAKVRQPDEFDFMVKLNSLTNKPSFHQCEKREGYVKLALEETEWREFRDEEGFFSPNMVCRHFKKLVNECLSEAEVPKELQIRRASQELLGGSWGPVFSDILGSSGAEDSASGVIYSETHGPATTLYIDWQGGETYKGLTVSVDLTLTIEYPLSSLPVQLRSIPQEAEAILHEKGFQVVPAAFDMWRVSFSTAERRMLTSAPDGFKTCYRVLKTLRDDISEKLMLESSLLPSYMFKTVLLSELFSKPTHFWENEILSQRIIHVLEIVLQGVKRGEIQNFLIPRCNQLAEGGHESKLRLCIVSEMLNRVKGLEMTRTFKEVQETKRCVRLLEMIDIVEYVFSSALAGKDLGALWNKMFVNIGNVPGSRRFGWFWNQFTDLNTTELDEDAYANLIEIWHLVEDAFKELLGTLSGELILLVQKFYIRTCEKKRKFEIEHAHHGLSTGHTPQQISLHQISQEMVDDLAESYVDEKNSSWANLHKAIPADSKNKVEVLRNVRDKTEKEGSEKGFDAFKQTLKRYLCMIPESVLMSVIVGFTGQLFLHAKETLTLKLEYIKIPELDLD